MYIIGTGFIHKPDRAHQATEFYNIWYDNTCKYSSPERVFILANGGCDIPGARGQWVNFKGNLGHTHDLTNHVKPHAMCGWSAAFVTLAMLAYHDECDFIFKEEDALAFGPWVDRMYSELGPKGMIFGNSKVYACAQSIVLCKHDFIPEFVRLYMGTGSEQNKENECELKFARLEKQHPDLFGRYSFGVDRDRPIPYDDEVFYCQQNTDKELTEMQNRGLI